MNRLSLSGSLVSAVLALGVPAAVHASGRPSIAVESPTNGSIVHSTSLTVHFQVRNFTLLSPGRKIPKHGTGFAGHIQARLDGLPINPATDLATSKIHTWQHIPAGHHVFTIWLANPLNVPIPGVVPAKLAFRIQPAAPAVPVRPRPVHHATSPGVGAAPRTGGADGVTTPELNYSLLLTALLSLFLGATLVSMRRLSFGLLGRRSTGESNAESDRPSVAPGPSMPVAEASPPIPPASVAPLSPTAARDTAMTYDVITGPRDAGSDPQAESTSDTDPGPIAIRTPQMLPATVTPPASVTPADDRSLAEAVEAARRWPDVVQELAQRIEQGAEERRLLQERITELEQVALTAQKIQSGLYATGARPLDDDDLSALRYVADELVRDPDHIVTLAAVSQHATRIHQLIEEYARLYALLYDEGNR